MAHAGSMSRGRRGRWALLIVLGKASALLVGSALALAACRKHEPDPEAVRRGREAWLTATFGGERFFSELMPQPPFDLVIGFDVMLTSDRDTRFDAFGAINNPNCTPGDASTGGYDRCLDPHASGVVGIRRFDDPSGGERRAHLRRRALGGGEGGADRVPEDPLERGPAELRDDLDGSIAPRHVAGPRSTGTRANRADSESALVVL